MKEFTGERRHSTARRWRLSAVIFLPVPRANMNLRQERISTADERR
jgi:hypothetical protein